MTHKIDMPPGPGTLYRYAFRYGFSDGCSAPKCDRRATHMCVTSPPDRRGGKRRLYCYLHAQRWLHRHQARLHDMGIVWRYGGKTPRAKARG